MGEMAKFRWQRLIIIQQAAKLNRYYTVTGTSWGPVFSALSMGGLYCHHTVQMMDTSK